MKCGVRTWVMIPVLLVLLLFPLGTFGIFSLTSGWYVSREANKRVAHMAAYLQEEAEEVSGFREGENLYQKEEAREKSVEMLKRVRTVMRKQPLHVSMVVFSSRLDEAYNSSASSRTEADSPAGTDSYAETGFRAETGLYAESNMLSREWRRLLKNGSLATGESTRVTIGGNPYVAQLYEVQTEYPIRGKYFIVYTRIADVSGLLLETGGLLLVIAMLLFLISLIAAWLIARQIERPIRELCTCTRQVGGGYGELEEKRYPIRELEQLRSSFVDMEKRLQESRKEKEEMFQGVSHDLRTPLVSIIGYADGIRRGIMPDTGKASEIILEESQRMKRMVDTLLTLSKLDSHSWSDRKVLLPLEEFLEEQTEILQGMAAEYGKKLLFLAAGRNGDDQAGADAGIDQTADGAGASCLIEADAQLLARIFQNVVSNCLRYAESQVRVCVTRADGRVKLFVEDDGPGIEEAERAHIFERDYRGANGQFGLGLAMAKSGMEHLNGTIDAGRKMPPEKGTVFTLSFPAV